VIKEYENAKFILNDKCQLVAVFSVLTKFSISSSSQNFPETKLNGAAVTLYGK
jgi:hypothetical protein